MGKGRKGTGVELRDTSIRVSFTLNGERCRETLELTPTEPNRRYAARLVVDINKAIDRGSFVYADFFPNSPRAGSKAAATIRDYGKKWMESRGTDIGNNTRSQYGNALAFWYQLTDGDGELLDGRALGDVPLREIVELDLLALIGKQDWSSAKLKNNYLTPLRGAFAAGCSEQKIPNPLAAVKNAKEQKKKPDPFTLQEAEQILAYMTRQFDPRVWAYFNWQFFTGMRPEETIALPRTHIDFINRTAHVEVVRTHGEDKEHTKTHYSRFVDINTRALQSLEVMRPYWGELDHELVFERPEWRPKKGSRGGRPAPAGAWNDARAQNDTYWKPTLAALGIRYRAPYKTRHTYATVGLMNDVDPAYMASQLGHDQKEFFDTYATWINGQANKREIAKIDAAITSNLSPIRPWAPKLIRSSEGKVGRRDWDRTNPRRKPTGTDGNEP